eukprot:1351121-Pyramimonas_sp.AAC.1
MEEREHVPLQHYGSGDMAHQPLELAPRDETSRREHNVEAELQPPKLAVRKAPSGRGLVQHEAEQ